MRLRFVSRNEHKIREVVGFLSPLGIDVTGVAIELRELQCADLDEIVRDKCLKAFEKIGRPLIVEHTGLSIEALGGLPGGLTQLFWDQLQADGVVSLLAGRAPGAAVTATTVIGYCDGKRLHLFRGEVKGTIAAAPAGSRDFQWDCIFVPEGHNRTYAELGDEKATISMRRKALEDLADHLSGGARR